MNMETKQCKMCAHFFQHYGMGEKRLFRLYCGHCKQGRIKHKKPDAPACTFFIRGERNEDAYASKEYLTKKLLEYVLEMELLPPIDEKTP